MPEPGSKYVSCTIQNCRARFMTAEVSWGLPPLLVVNKTTAWLVCLYDLALLLQGRQSNLHAMCTQMN